MNQGSLVFERMVETWVAAQLSAGYTSYAHLLERLPSVYPTIALDAVRRLAARGQIAAHTARAIEREAHIQPILTPRPRSLLPLPHPINYEWRFTPDAARLLLDLADDICEVGQPILLFGTPGVAIEALSRPLQRPVIFLGEPNTVTHRLTALNQASGAPLTIEFCNPAMSYCNTASVIILDPPWYLDYVRPMLASAVAACRIGGYVLISLPPEGARSKAADDRAKVMTFAAHIGLVHLDTRTFALTYETPFFEANALAAAGLQAPHSWRRGDLVVFRKAETLSRAVPTASDQRNYWYEVMIGRMRLYVRRRSVPLQSGCPIISLVDGDILPTVSRKDPRRKRAQLWTSGNRIFATNNPELVITVALALSSNEEDSGTLPLLWATIEERDEVRRLKDYLRSLARLESSEERSSRFGNSAGRSEKWQPESTNSWVGSSSIASG